jgi:hypothetical protein
LSVLVGGGSAIASASALASRPRSASGNQSGTLARTASGAPSVLCHASENARMSR